MFQNIVNATEPMTEEKEAIGYISNNPVRKEIVMYDPTTAYNPTAAGFSCFTGLCISALQGHDDDRL